jgi:hypothetical protein
MGILLIQLLRARGALTIGAARGKAKVDAVAEAGADTVVDYGRPDWTSEVLNATGGRRPDVVLDGVGGQLGREAYGIITDGGRFSAHGTPSGSFASIDAGNARQRNIAVSGIGDLQVQPGERAQLARQILRDLLSGQISPLIGQAFPLSNAVQAHEAIEARITIAKTLLTPTVLCRGLRRQSASCRPSRFGGEEPLHGLAAYVDARENLADGRVPAKYVADRMLFRNHGSTRVRETTCHTPATARFPCSTRPSGSLGTRPC